MKTLRDWALDALERATKTAAQAILAMWVASDGFNLFEVDWQATGGVALGAAVVSILSSLAGRVVGDKNDASIVR